MRFDEKFGTLPKLLLKQIKKHGPLPEPSKELLPVEVRTRMEHLPGFDDEIYFRFLPSSLLFILKSGAGLEFFVRFKLWHPDFWCGYIIPEPQPVFVVEGRFFLFLPLYTNRNANKF